LIFLNKNASELAVHLEESKLGSSNDHYAHQKKECQMFLTFSVGETVDKWIDSVDVCPWSAHAGRVKVVERKQPRRPRALYTPEERVRRDASRWTLVQGILAPFQFLVFVISLALVLRYLATGEGLAVATASIVVKTLVLYAIMITGSIWERDVFGRYLFAPAFFWEDVVSMLVLALHTAYLIVLVTGAMSPDSQMILALAAYTAYLVNATQFLLKLRAARLQEIDSASESTSIQSNIRFAE
jgi:3-vinyl bacteriochlorophyllide hydratase